MSYEYLSTGNNEYPTPVNLFKSIEDYFGKFDIDLSATKENTKCDIFFTKEQDSLKQDWNYNMCWCNPPYSKDLQPLFIEKAYHTNIKYNNTIVILIPFRADTKVWHKYIWGKADIYIFEGRIKYLEGKSPTYASALVVFNEKEDKHVYKCDKDFSKIEMIY